MASSEDPHFSTLAQDRAHLFWQGHSQNKPSNFYGDHFKTLITMMLQANPRERISTAEIIAHPWLAEGGIATEEQVQEEFTRRFNVNKQRAEADREQKRIARENNAVRRAFKMNGKIYINFDDLDPENNTENLEVVRLRPKEFDERKPHLHSFFSDWRPDVLFNKLAEKLQEQD